MVSSHVRGSSVSSMPPRTMPTLFTNPRRPPSARTAPSTIAGASPPATSPGTAATIASGATARIAATVSSARPASRSFTAIAAPCAASVMAIAAPMPDPAPVTRTGSPSSSTVRAVPMLLPSSSGERDEHVLRAHVLHDPFPTTDLAVAAVLEPARRRRPAGRRTRAVDPDVAGVEVRRDPQRAVEVARDEVRGEAVARPVRQRDRLLLVADARDREHRPEHLVLREL